MSSFFPLFVDVTQFQTVIIGGGQIAERRIQVLRQFDAHILLIAPETTEALQQLAATGQILWLQRPYQEGDLADASIGMAIIATNQREVNHNAGKEAVQNGIPVSVADRKEESTFYFPGIAKKDNIVAGITASGMDHKEAARVTKKIRQFLEEE